MADDIRLKITGDIKSAKKLVKNFEKLVGRFERANKRATKRRIQEEKKATEKTKDIRQRNIQRLLNLDAKQNKEREKSASKSALAIANLDAKKNQKRIKDAEKSARSIAQKERKSSEEIIRINTQEERRLTTMRNRLSRKRARNRLRATKASIRQERREAKAKERILRKHAVTRQRILRGASRFGGRGIGLLGLGGVAGAVFKGREILKFDEVLARVAGQAKVSTEEQFRLRDAINAASIATGVSRDVLLDAVRRIVDKSGEFDVAAQNVEELGKVIKGTGVDATDLGELVAALAAQFAGIGGPKGVLDFLEILIAQGDEGVVNLQELAKESEKLIGAFTRAGLKSREEFIGLGALVQLSGRGGGSPEAATFAANFLSQIRKRKNVEKVLKRFPKINIVDEKGALLSIRRIIPELIKATGGNLQILQGIIPQIRGVAPLELAANEENMKKFIRSLHLGETAAGNIQRRFERVADTSSQGFDRMAAGITLFADKALVGILNDMADSMTRLIDDPEKMKQLVNSAEQLGKALQLAGKGAEVLLKLISIPGQVGEGIGDVIGGLLFNRESPTAKKIRKQSQALLKRKIESGAPLPEDVLSGIGDIGRARHAKALELRVSTNIQTDASGKIKSSETTAVLNDPDRGESKITVGE